VTLHRVRVVPVRLYSFDEGLVVDKVRVVGYRPKCLCGWV